MSKHRAGLHKEISSIFDGVPIPKRNGSIQAASKPLPEQPGYERYTAANKLRLKMSAGQEREPSAPLSGSAGPSHAERPVQPQPVPKAAHPEQPQAGTPAKAGGPNPVQKIWQKIESKLPAPKPGVSAARQKTMMLLIPILFIALIFILFQVFGTAPLRTKGATQDNTPHIGTGSSNKIDWQAPDPYPTTLRDPMRLQVAATAAAQTGELAVTGILYDRDNPSTSTASICNQIVYEGDKVKEATVVKINKNSVEFEMNGKKWTQRVQR